MMDFETMQEYWASLGQSETAQAGQWCAQCATHTKPGEILACQLDGKKLRPVNVDCPLAPEESRKRAVEIKAINDKLVATKEYQASLQSDNMIPLSPAGVAELLGRQGDPGDEMDTNVTSPYPITEAEVPTNPNEASHTVKTGYHTGYVSSDSMHLPTSSKDRKGLPICTGVVDYFPRAMAAIAGCSKAGSDQHNPGLPLFWDRTKSMDHADCIIRHLIDRGTTDVDGIRHSTKVAWRALALLELELEGDNR